MTQPNAANTITHATFSQPSERSGGWKWERLTAADMKDALTPSGMQALNAWLDSSKSGDELDLSDPGLPLVLVRD